MGPRLPISILTITLAVALLSSARPALAASAIHRAAHRRGARGHPAAVLARVVIGADSSVTDLLGSGEAADLLLGSGEEERKEETNPFKEITDTISQLSGATANVTKALDHAVSAVEHVAKDIQSLQTTGRGEQGVPLETFSAPGIISSIVGGVSKAANTIESIASAVTSAAEKVAGIAEKSKEIATTLQPFLAPVTTGGNSKADINLAVLWGLLAVGGATFFGWVLDAVFPPLDTQSTRPRFWLVGMLLASFAVLIPGLTETLFSFDVAIHIFGVRVTVTSDPSGTPGPITESTISVIGLLWSSGSHLGAVLIILYAMVIPVLKLILLCLGELWRCSEDPSRVHVARGCIKTVQIISKWACPDMFAYILLLYLVRSLDLRSSTIEAPAQLDIGFICFSIFCTFSTVTSLAIQLPPKPQNDENFTAAAHPPLLLSWFGRRGIYWAVAAALGVFTVLMVGGLFAPVMHMGLDDDLLIEPEGPLPSALSPLLSILKSEVDAEVTMISCIGALVQWFCYGEASCILALVMLLGFAIIFPVLDMLCLFLATARFRDEPVEKGKRFGQPTSSKIARTASFALSHLSMLDVTIMGIVVVSLAAGVYKDQGIVIGMNWGIYLLLAAEIVHYLTYFSVQRAFAFLDPPPEEPPEAVCC